MANALTADKARRIVELHEEGLTRVTIAERLGVHRHTVERYLCRAGCAPVSRKLTEESVREMRRAGRHRNVAELARLFGVTERAVRYVLRRQRWRRV